MAASVSVVEPVRTEYRAAGIMRDAQATAIREDMVEAAVKLKFCSMPLAVPVRELWMPPVTKQHPGTRRMLERMLPSMLDWTMRTSPLRRATMHT